MSQKNKDDKNRWRNKTVAFRMSPEEANQLNTFVKLSGLSKQDYLIKRSLQREIVVQASSRTYKALRNQLAVVQDLLQSFSSASEMPDELLQIISQMTLTLDGFKNEQK